MKVRLTRKLADAIDGVDLSHKRVGRVINVGRHDAQLLIAEGWGQPADALGERSPHLRERADDRPPPKPQPRRKHRK